MQEKILFLGWQRRKNSQTRQAQKLQELVYMSLAVAISWKLKWLQKSLHSFFGAACRFEHATPVF